MLPGAMPLAGHFWTIAPNLRHRLLPRPAPTSQAWSTTLVDPRLGPVTLRGALAPGASDGLVVLVHGLGGAPESQYMVQAARAAARLGLGSLRLALRGADRSGEDVYHAGLVADLEAALRSPALAAYRRLYLAGFSLGGHVSLRLGLAPPDPRLRALASLCAPLDLSAACAAIDAPAARIYCGHVVRGLQEIYRPVAERGRGPTPLAQVVRVRTVREWDRHVVVPRFGFASVDDYHARESVGPRLPELALPSLIAAAEHDPMVPAATLRPVLEDLPPHVKVRWLDRGGHLGFPPRAARAPAPTVLDEVMSWLAQH